MSSLPTSSSGQLDQRSRPHIPPELAGYHEIRSPLGLISTIARFASNESELREVRKQLASITRIADRTLRTVSEALVPERAVVPGTTVHLARIAVALARDYRRAGRRVRVSMNGEMPYVAAHARPFVEALLQTLLAGAFEHGDHAELVVLELSEEQDTLRLSVQNAAASHPAAQGLGMGTAITNALVFRLGGAVTFDQTDRYFTVTVSVPLTDAGTSRVIASLA